MNDVPTGTRDMSKEISYEVKLVLDRGAFPRLKVFEVEKEETPSPSLTVKAKYKSIGRREDILTLNKPTRVYLIDNGAADGEADDDNKPKFYVDRGLMRLVDVFIPFRLMVTKFEKNRRVSMRRQDNVMAVFEITDPPEDVANVKGPRPGIPGSRTGKPFIEALVGKVQSGKNKEDDNCIQDFAPNTLLASCRTDKKKVKASSILWWKKGRSPERFTPLPTNEFLGAVPINPRRQGVRIYFNPPPTLGDNYSFKITLTDEKWKKITLRKPAQTPTITIWKRVKIELVALQGGLPYNVVKWDELENAYGDAFTEILQPPNDRRHRIVISKNQWKRYLEAHVYSTWKNADWQAYRAKDSDRSLDNDLNNFSFPQDPNLVPPNDPTVDPNHTAKQLSTNLADIIFNAHLSRQSRRNINNPLRGANVGLCVICYNPPNPDSTIAGTYLRSLGGKRFMLFKAGDVTSTFAHEMGHALFLKHGATKFIHDIAKPVIVESTLPSSAGPYWDEHYSEDTISCIMSYGRHFYDQNGVKRARNPTDWHFCGVCLLILRFYSVAKMSQITKSNDSFRKLNYFRSKPEIAQAAEGTRGTTKYLSDWTFKNSLTMRVAEKRRLLVIYPLEVVTNNLGKTFWKDICHHPRGKWVSSQPGIAKVTPKEVGNIWISELIAAAPTLAGKTVEIKFQMVYGPNPNDVNESSPIKVTVTT